MAKLKAHGTELLRIERYETKRDSLDGSSYQVRHVKVYMSDGYVMTKFYAQIKTWNGGLEWHDYGWKRGVKFVSSTVSNPREQAEFVRNFTLNNPQTGWKVVL